MNGRLLLILLILPLLTLGADDVVLLPEDSSAPSVKLHEFKWQFRAGDSLSWSSAARSGSGWVSLNPRFGIQDLPNDWKGFGWFRIWVRKSNQSTLSTLGLYINHDGASQIYWDGRKVGELGVFATTEAAWVPKRDPYCLFPVAVTDTLPHLLSIRYANFLPAYSDFVGFQLWAGDMHSMNAKQKDSQRFMDFFLPSGAAQLILVVLHLLLFIFYPGNRVNLYYSIYVLNISSGVFSRYLSITATDPFLQAGAFRYFLFATVAINFTQLMLLYSVSYQKLPKWRLLFLGGITLAMICYEQFYWVELAARNSKITWDWISAGIKLVFYVEGARAVFTAIHKGNRRLWLIALGMAIVGVFDIMMGMNMFDLFTFRDIMASMAAITLLFPVLFSIYLAMDVAATNRQLTSQIKENQLLSDQMLLQQQEKIKIVAEQAQRLEQTVLERTAQVREQAERLREMDAIKSRFFVNLTHEFKTPLTLIINPARELLKQSDNETSRQYATFILRSSERLLQLINQLLDLSRLESGQVQVDGKRFDLVQWLQLLVEQFASMAHQKNAELALVTNVSRLNVYIDADKLEKITQNLISNALKFIENNGVVTVSLNAIDDRYFEICVTDDGIGIPAEKLAFIFDRFYQVDLSDARTREGAGIGLALSRELTSLLGGTISAQSELGAGTRFTVRFPNDEPVDECSDSPKQPPLIGVEPDASLPARIEIVPSQQGLHTVLVIEDNAQLREFIAMTLSGRFNVLTACDGDEGLRMAWDQVPHLIITDLMMPHKNGYQVCEMLKADERSSHIPLIMLTAKTDRESRIQGVQTGADAYLDKPFDQRELTAVMNNLIRVRQQLRQKYSKSNPWLTGVEDLPSIEQSFLGRVFKAVDAYLDDSTFGPEELGREVGLSRTQLHRKMTELIDKSPGQLIRNMRMQKAHDLLEKNVATVSEVCYMVGYGNPANFSTSFSKQFGYPPSAVRIQVQ